MTSRVSAVVASIATMLVAISAANATLTATMGKDAYPANAKIMIAKDDGSAKRVLAAGAASSVSPDGSRVAVTHYDEAKRRAVNLRLEMFPAAGGPRMFTIKIECWDPAWSPDSKKLACAASGASNRLVVIDATTGSTRTLGIGDFDRPSFSPDSTRLAYVQRARGPSYRVGGTLKVVDLATGSVTALRTAAARPVWGPNAIAFSTVVSRPRYDILNVALIQPDGTGFHQITNIRARLVIFGIFPVAWSADGQRLLGGVVGQDAWTTRESYAIDPIRGGFRLIAHSLMPSALSRDGKYVIGQTGDPECCGYKYSNIVRVPWAGGKRQVLIRHAMVASFNG